MTREEFLERTYISIENVRSNPEAAKTLKQVGWTTQDTTQGLNLYQTAYGALANQKEKNSQKLASTDELRTAERELRQLYQQHLTLARIAVPYDRGIYQSLELSGTREVKRSAWLEQVRRFYDNINKIEVQLAPFGVTPEVIAQAQAMIEAVVAARAKQFTAKGAAQQARTQREEAYEELDAWMKKFVRAARYAFAETPQQLEAFGIIVK
ncbi:MAG: hypothetical protein AAF992_02290 [Bacteroidota bacterium]